MSEFLNILQGQSPGGLKNEPPETTGIDAFPSVITYLPHLSHPLSLFLPLSPYLAALFDLLMKIVTDTTMENSKVAKDLSCMASSCLLSLVIALGETSKMLAAVASLLIAPSGVSDGIVKVSLLCSVQD